MESVLKLQRDSMLQEILSNRTLVFPPPIMDPRFMYRRLSSRVSRYRNVTGRRLLRYFVSLKGENVDSSVISQVTDQLWEHASHQEKTNYILLASQVNNQINERKPISQRITVDPMDTDTTTVDLINTDTVTVDPMDIDSTTVDPMDIEIITEDLEAATVDSPIKSFADFGYSNLSEIISWWEDEKELHEEDSVEDIIVSFFYEKFSEANDFMDIIDDPYFSQQTKSALLEINDDFQAILDDYTPWEWFSWYIHMSYMFTIRTPAPCPFNSVKTKLPENLQHFYYQGTISKQIKDEEVEQLREFINLIMEIKHPGQDDSKVWYHGTTSVAASRIARRIDLTVCSHFNHAFGFRRSFYIGDNLKYCLTRALKAARISRTVNCALVVFCINEGELHLIQDYLKLISNEDSQGHVNTGNIWEEIVPASKDSNENSNLDEDPIRSNVQWVEGANLEKRNNGNNVSWIPKRDDIIRSFRTDESAQFLHSQLAYIITLKNPRIN